MNISSPIPFPQRNTPAPAPRSRRLAAAGFTLVEVVIAMAIFIVIIGGMVSVQIFGLRVYTLASTKLIATTAGRETMNDLRDQIRESQQVYVGTFSNSTFNQIPNGQQQIGNALQIYTTTNSASTNFLVYYQDPSSNAVFVYANTPANKSVECTYMTNYNCFYAEDYTGTVVSNYINNPVIRVVFNFSQWEYPIAYIAASSNSINAYDYYYLRTRITRRVKSQN